jgi:biopolymer transport protein ExbD
MKFKRSKVLHETVELNITAFLNLMVILVPFLLITAVFSRLTVLELTLPGLDAAGGEEQKIDLELQLLIYPDALEIRDANVGRIRYFDTSEKTDWSAIVDVLVEIKRRYPEETAISLLLDSAVPYKRLIEVMDRVRSAEIVNVGTLEEVELFPAISIGEAPARAAADENTISLDALPVKENEGGVQ